MYLKWSKHTLIYLLESRCNKGLSPDAVSLLVIFGLRARGNWFGRGVYAPYTEPSATCNNNEAFFKFGKSVTDLTDIQQSELEQVCPNSNK